MNFQYLKYLVALYRKKSFTEAAEFCGVSQPAMSTAIKNLENDLGAKIYERNVKPISFTSKGLEVLEFAHKILLAVEDLENRMDNSTEKKELNLAVIPTLAPYMVPKLVKLVDDHFPNCNLQIEEAKTEMIIKQIKQGDIDLGLVVTPIKDPELEVFPILYEEFLIYAHPSMKPVSEIKLHDINCSDLWLLEEGHCLRNQIMEYCTGPKKNPLNIKYNAGSMETLINLIDDFGGKTILPDLATRRLDKAKRERLHFFTEPSPAREVSMVRLKNANKKNIALQLIDLTKKDMPAHMKNPSQYQVLGMPLS